MTVSRITLPQEFYDITSTMLLSQPEPQYPFALFALSALGQGLALPPALGLAGRAIGGGGPGYGSAEDDRLRLMRELFSAEMVAVKQDFKSLPGSVLRINRPSYTNSTYTAESRQLATGVTISTTSLPISSEQTDITLSRYGGPYGASSVQPYAIERFDANMAIHDVASIVGRHLMRDFHRWLDAVMVNVATTGATAVYPDGFSADDGMTLAGSGPLTYEQISRVAATMDTANLPLFSNGRRVMIVDPDGKKQLKDDPQFARYAEFHRDMNPLFPGYFNSLPEFDLYVSTTLQAVNNSSSVSIKRGLALAPGWLGLGMGRPPTVATSTDDNYGETVRCIWLADLGWRKLDNRFTYSVRYSA